MKTRIFSLLLTPIVLISSCCSDSLASRRHRSRPCWRTCSVMEECESETVTLQEPIDHDLRALLESRRDNLKSFVAQILLRLQAEKHHDPGTRITLIEFRQLLFDAEFNLATTTRERLLLMEELLDHLMNCQNDLKRRNESGETILRIQADRQELECDLSRAKSGELSVQRDSRIDRFSADPPSQNPQLRKLQENVRDTLKQLLALTFAQLHNENQHVASRVMRIPVLRQEILGVELSLSQSDEERTRLIETASEELLQLEIKLKRRREHWEATLRIDVVRIQLQIELLKAKKDKWTGTNNGVAETNVADVRKDPDFRTLLQEKSNTLKQLLDYSIAVNAAGGDPFRILHLADYRREFLFAELALAGSKEDQIGTLQETLTYLESLENQMARRIGFVSSVVQIRDRRIQTEIDLYRATQSK